MLGASDGLVSTSSLLAGVSATAVDHHTLLITGVASIVAGSCSMAVGEFVSVSTQRDSEAADLSRQEHVLEREGPAGKVCWRGGVPCVETVVQAPFCPGADRFLPHRPLPMRSRACACMPVHMPVPTRTRASSPPNPPRARVQAAAIAVLARSYQAKGLPADLAHDVATTLTEHSTNPAGVHARAKHGVEGEELASPVQAAMSSLAAFTAGGCAPLAAAAMAPPDPTTRSAAIFLVTLAMLAVTGVLSSRLGGVSVTKGTARVIIGGCLAMSASEEGG